MFLTTLGAVGACRSPAPSSNQTAAHNRVIGRQGGRLSYRVASPPRTLNYLLASDEPSVIVSFYLTGGRLVEYDHDSLRYIPGVAEKWKLAEDGRTIEVALREGVRFSDGHPLTAEDVAFTFRALYDEGTPSPVFRDAMTIGGRPIIVNVVDSHNLRLVFPEPVASPESYLSNLAVLPSHVLGAELEQGKFNDAYSLTTDPQHVVTSGAFTIEAVAPGERTILKRNPHYWKKDGKGTPLPYVDELVIEVAGDANNALTRLQQGTLDVLDRIRPSDYVALRAQAGRAHAVDAGPGLQTDHLWFNLNGDKTKGGPAAVKLGWFDDSRFRRAVSHAIDRESIASVNLQGLATPLYGFVSPGNVAWVAPDLPHTEYDLEKARTMLREAGFTVRGSSDAPELYDRTGHRVEFTTIVPVESSARMAMAAVIQEDLARLGMKMNLAPLEFGELTRRISKSYQYDAVLLGASITEPDPSSYAPLLLSSSPSHQWHPSQAHPSTEWEARIDSLLTAQAREVDPLRRHALFNDIQLILAEQLPVIPIVSRHLVSAADQRVGNHHPSTLPPYSLWNAEELFVRQ
jgi:peptide/nickel transport system substrate-binding protein